MAVLLNFYCIGCQLTAFCTLAVAAAQPPPVAEVLYDKLCPARLPRNRPPPALDRDTDIAELASL